MANVNDPHIRYGRAPDDAFTLWGGPCDGQVMTVARCEHGDWPDVVVPVKSRTLPGVTPPDDWTPQRSDVRYRYNAETNRYEYLRQEPVA